MKIKSVILLLFFSLVLFNKNLLANTVIFDSKNIKIENNGNLIFATDGVANIPSQNISIEGKKSTYNKNISELTVIGNVKFFDNLNKIYIESEKATYDELNNTILTDGNTFIKLEDKYKIYSQDVLFDRNSMKILSKIDTTAYDNKENIYNFNADLVTDNLLNIPKFLKI